MSTAVGAQLGSHPNVEVMAKRRGHGEGSVYQRKDGYWVGSVECGRYPNGRRRRARVVRRYKNGDNGVLAGLDELKKQIAEGVVPDRTTTVAKYLDFWLTEVMQGQVSEGSYREYEKRVRRVIPHIGHIKLGRLTKAHVQALANRLAEQYPRSPATRSQTLTTLKRALKWAAGNIIPSNPAQFIEAPKTKTAKVDDTLDEAEAKDVLKAAESDDLYALFWLALKYGLRLGELINLRWSDIDFKSGEMTVATAKTRAGERTLPLIEDAKAVLKAHRKGSKLTSLDGHVFLRPTGRPLSQQWAGEQWSALLERAGISHLCRNCGVECTHGPETERPCRDCRCSTHIRRFHCSRHTAATLLLEAGVELEVVSAILGHANIGITADLYARVRADLKRKGLEKLG